MQVQVLSPVFPIFAGFSNRIESLLLSITTAPHQREYYTTAEAAELLDRAEFTVREWCRNGRIVAIKTHGGRGNATEWRISHDEIESYRNEGLLPVSNYNL